MPLIEHNIYPDSSESGIWYIEESPDDFLNELELRPDESKEYDALAFDTRRLQWLSSRLLIYKMSGRMHRGLIIKNEKGKPRLQNSEFSISLSHSERYVAAAAAPYAIGVDIQVKTDKIIRILDKFTNKKENQICRSSGDYCMAHLIWSAKECMFKAYGEGQVDFREHLFVNTDRIISQDQKSGFFSGQMIKNKLVMEFEFEFQQDDNMVFVVGKHRNI